MLKKVVLAVGLIAIPSIAPAQQQNNNPINSLNNSYANSNARRQPRKAKGLLEAATP